MTKPIAIGFNAPFSEAISAAKKRAWRCLCGSELGMPAGGLIQDYLELAWHGNEEVGALFRPLSNNTKTGSGKTITPNGIYKLVQAYSCARGFTIGAHSLRATAATNALDHQADIAKV